MKTFTYQGDLYIRCIPGKQLFRSTMVHEVVNRGDIFALRVSDQLFTVIPGTAQVEHTEHWVIASAETLAKELAYEQRKQPDEALARAERARNKLRAISIELNRGADSIAEATRIAAGKQPGLFDGEIA